MRRFGPSRTATAGGLWRCRRRCGSPRLAGRLLPGPCRTPIRERWPMMIRPGEHAASSLEPISQRRVGGGRVPAPFAELLPSREDGAKLWTVWGFDSYFRAANERLLGLL